MMPQRRNSRAGAGALPRARAYARLAMLHRRNTRNGRRRISDGRLADRLELERADLSRAPIAGRRVLVPAVVIVPTAVLERSAQIGRAPLAEPLRRAGDRPAHPTAHILELGATLHASLAADDRERYPIAERYGLELEQPAAMLGENPLGRHRTGSRELKPPAAST
jgi:hypothetical protein